MFKFRFPLALVRIVLPVLALMAMSLSALRGANSPLCIGNVTELNPTIPLADMSGIIFFANRFIAVSTNGVSMESGNGTTWTQNTVPGLPTLNALASNSTEVIAAGNSGASFSTTTGQSWNILSTIGNGTNAINAITWTGTQWVAVGDASEIDTSPDGKTWTTQIPGLAGTNLQGVVFTGFAYVAVGANATIQVSSDGKNWHTTSAGGNVTAASTFYGVAYDPDPGNQVLAIVSDTSGMFYSTDQGATWNAATSYPAGTWYSVRWFENLGLFVAVGAGESVATSSDARTWTLSTTQTSPPITAAIYALRDVAVNPTSGHMVAVGDRTTIFNSGTTFATWNQFYTGVYTPLTAMATDGGLGLVELGPTLDYLGTSVLVAHSPNAGKTFGVGTMPLLPFSGNNTFTPFLPNAIAYSPLTGSYVAVGNDYSIENSVDGGVTWTLVRSFEYFKNANVGEMPPLNAITWDGSEFVAVGNQPNSNQTLEPATTGTVNFIPGTGRYNDVNNVQFSPDGTTWHTVSAVGVSLNAVASNGNNRVVVAGSNNEVAVTSDMNDGSNAKWVGQELAVGTASLTGVAYGNGLWVVVGQNGAAYTSPDVTNPDGTMTWTVSGLGGANSTLNAVTYGAGFFYAFAADGNIYMSIDTVSWLPCVGPAASGEGLVAGLVTQNGVAFLGSGNETFQGQPPASVPDVIITRQPPRNVNGVVGKAFTLSTLGTSGNLQVFYQWRRDGADLTQGANGGSVQNPNNSTLTINPARVFSGGNYTAVVSNGLKSKITHIAKVTIFNPPSITTFSTNKQVIPPGSDLVLSVAAAGSPTLRYQWLFKGKPLTNNSVVHGATSPTLTITVSNPQRSGSYSVKITNPYGSVTSKIVTVKFN